MNMDTINKLLYETDTSLAHYQVWDTVYGGRPARVLYSGQRFTAQSGIARDDRPELLFDYNQRLLELANGIQPARLLLIGGGVYTLPMALLRTLSHSHIDVVEIDTALEAIARKFFGLRSDSRLSLIPGDGLQYLEQNQQPYDMILIDAFINDGTPNTFKTAAAIKQYKRNLTAHGVLARNVISAFQGVAAVALQTQLRAYDEVFPDVCVFPAGLGLPLVVAQNLLIVAQATKHWPLEQFLPHPALSRSLNQE